MPAEALAYATQGDSLCTHGYSLECHLVESRLDTVLVVRGRVAAAEVEFFRHSLEPLGWELAGGDAWDALRILGARVLDARLCQPQRQATVGKGRRGSERAGEGYGGAE